MKTNKLYSVSYVDGPQRVVLFTTDENVAEMVTRKEASGMEIFVAFNGIQVSLINNVNLEIATISITGSSANWTLRTKNEFKVNISLLFMFYFIIPTKMCFH